MLNRINHFLFEDVILVCLYFRQKRKYKTDATNIVDLYTFLVPHMVWNILFAVIIFVIFLLNYEFVEPFFDSPVSFVIFVVAIAIVLAELNVKYMKHHHFVEDYIAKFKTFSPEYKKRMKYIWILKGMILRLCFPIWGFALLIIIMKIIPA